MRWTTLMCLALACGGSPPDETPTDDTDTGTTTVAPTDSPPAADTALATFVVAGDATIDLTTYSGTERFELTARSSGELLCRYVWQAVDWDSDPDATGADPITQACEDPSGAPCAWSFTVRTRDGRPDGGDRCAELGLSDDPGLPGDTVGWGWHPDYLGLGASTMYYDAVFGGGWLATEAGAFSPAAGEFTYEQLQGYQAYLP
jgi:hypothetical protein